jgi:hypothetical protein
MSTRQTHSAPGLLAAAAVTMVPAEPPEPPRIEVPPMTTAAIAGKA